MAKSKSIYACEECGYESAKWLGKCPGCESWGTLTERAIEPEAPKTAARHAASLTNALPFSDAELLTDIPEDGHERKQTGIGEFDRVLGGGVVDGSLVLIGGDPGIGKSTLLLQVSALLSAQGARVLYVSGEESKRQIGMRARRLGVAAGEMYVCSETSMDRIEAQRVKIQPDYMIIDSIQTMYRPDISSAPGSVSQVRECAAMLMRAAKTTGCAMFLVGHVTKEGSLAGPRVLEHMVDAVLYFEGDLHHQFRILRAVKNRFGSVNELGIFEMRDSGMTEVANPSELLLSKRARDVSGSCVVCAVEGSRPVLVDVQALVALSQMQNPRRNANGVDNARLAMLLAVIERRAGMTVGQRDVYINVAGGLELSEPAADLSICASIISSLVNKPVPHDFVVLGEIGLAGEVRAVGQAERRLRECVRLGFTGCVLPRDCMKGIRVPDGIKAYGVDSVQEAVKLLF